MRTFQEVMEIKLSPLTVFEGDCGHWFKSCSGFGCLFTFFFFHRCFVKVQTLIPDVRIPTENIYCVGCNSEAELERMSVP